MLSLFAPCFRPKEKGFCLLLSLCCVLLLLLCSVSRRADTVWSHFGVPQQHGLKQMTLSFATLHVHSAIGDAYVLFSLLSCATECWCLVKFCPIAELFFFHQAIHYVYLAK